MINHEEIIKTFFAEGSEEQQIRFRELATKLDIRPNDAIWTIVYVLNYFGRFYAGLPKEIQESKKDLLEKVEEESADIVKKEVEASKGVLADAIVEAANQIAHRQSLVSYLTTSSAFCIGVFCLCLMCFVAGAAVAGKGWGNSPIGALLHAPAGWILPICMVPMSIYRGFHAYRAFQANKEKRKELAWLSGCVFMILLAGLMFLYVL